MVRIANVPIRDLLLLLSQISESYDLVDIILDPSKGKIMINPVEIHSTPRDPETPEDIEEELTEDNIYDII